MARNEEFGNKEEEWDLTKIDQSVARALAGQSHLSHRVIQVANFSSPPKQTSTANTSSDLSDYNEDIFSSTKPEEFAAIDERVKLQYRRKLTMRAAAVSVKSDDNKPTSESLVVEKPCFFNKLMRFFSKGNQDCRE
ncbi:hypothetical protein THAOC_18167, partial [Thalassiosira oceanica]